MVEVIHGQIIAKANNYMAIGGRLVKTQRIRDYEKTFAYQCKHYANKQISQPFKLVADIYYRNGAYDLDNSLKTLLDCLQYVGAIRDDNLCKQIIATKHIDCRHPRVEFSIIADAPPPTLFDGMW